MKRPTYAVLLLVTSLTVSCSKPEDHLKGHYEKMESIMADGKDDPEKGIERFIGYFEKHAPEIAKLQMEMQISVARIEKVGDREKRVKEIQEDFETVEKNLDGTAMDFMKAVAADKKAKVKMDDFQKRMSAASDLVEFGMMRGF